MLKREQINQRGQISMVDAEELVPKDHLLRKIDAAINFNAIYEEAWLKCKIG